MKTQLISRLAVTLFLLSCGAEWVLGNEVPRKSPVGRYAKLWTQSAFTEKPPPPEPDEVISELEDYTLAGVSPLEGGYSVVLINKKERDKRVHLMPGLANKLGFKVVGVRQDPISSKNTTVEIATASGKTGRIGYEEKFLALKTAAAKPAAKRPTTAQPAAKPPVPRAGNPPNAGNQTPRKPRVRRVPTPPTNR